MSKSIFIGAACALLLSTAGAASAIETHNLGGSAKGDPSTVWYKFAGKDAVAVFVRGSDGHLYAQVGDGQGAGWTGWAQIGEEVLKGDPACAAFTTGRIDCVAVGKNNEVHHVSYDALSHAWSDWQSIGGFATGDPGVAVTSDGGATILNVFVRGPGDLLFHNATDGAAWTDWQNLGVTVGGDVACTDILVLGAHCYDTSSGSADQYSDLTRQTGPGIFVDHLGGAVEGKVSAMATGAGGDTLRVFVNGPGHRLWFRKWAGAWQEWKQLPETVLSAPGCAIRKGGGNAWCAAIEPDGSVKMIMVEAGEM